MEFYCIVVNSCDWMVLGAINIPHGCVLFCAGVRQQCLAHTHMRAILKLFFYTELLPNVLHNYFITIERPKPMGRFIVHLWCAVVTQLSTLKTYVVEC